MSQKKLRNQSHINRAVNEMRAAFIKQKQKEHFYATPKNEPEGEQKKLQEKYRSSEIEHH